METIDHELISNILCEFFKRKIENHFSHEYNVALIAYNLATTSYKEEFGDSKAYTKAVIIAFLIEYCYKNSIPLEFCDDKTSFSITPNSKEEINLLIEKLKEFRISFNKLLNSSPKTLKDRNMLLNVAALCLREPFIIHYLKRTKKLPLKRISIFSEINIHLLKKHNYYIIFLMLILIKDTFLFFKSYLNIKVGDDFGA